MCVYEMKECVSVSNNALSMVANNIIKILVWACAAAQRPRGNIYMLHDVLIWSHTSASMRAFATPHILLQTICYVCIYKMYVKYICGMVHTHTAREYNVIYAKGRRARPRLKYYAT